LYGALAKVGVAFMVSPQLENGYTKLANELLEAFYCAKLKEYERICVMHIWRKTYGWNKKEDWIANSQFAEATGIPKPHITRTLKSLRDKNIITSSGNKTTVNKDYSGWKVQWRKLPHQVTTVTSPGNKKLPHQVPTKERKKIIIKSEDKSSPNEEDMFNQYSDDYEEGAIDIDGDGALEAPQKPKTKKYPHAPVIRKIFQEVLGNNPANWKVNKTQLQACENLYTERGEQKVRNALEWYQEHRELEYCPQITSPYDLDSKYIQLSRFKHKYEN
jgi:phage replication O-like protein O